MTCSFRHVVAIVLLVLVARPASAQHRAPSAWAPPRLPTLVHAAHVAPIADSTRRTWTPPRRYLVALTLGAIAGSIIAYDVARRRFDGQDDPTFGAASMLRAFPVFLLGSVGGGAAGITIVWLVDVLRADRTAVDASLAVRIRGGA